MLGNILANVLFSVIVESASLDWTIYVNMHKPSTLMRISLAIRSQQRAQDSRGRSGLNAFDRQTSHEEVVGSILKHEDIAATGQTRVLDRYPTWVLRILMHADGHLLWL